MISSQRQLSSYGLVPLDQLVTVALR